METLRFTNRLLCGMCVLSVATLLVLVFKNGLTNTEREQVKEITHEVLADVLEGYQFEIVE